MSSNPSADFRALVEMGFPPESVARALAANANDAGAALESLLRSAAQEQPQPPAAGAQYYKVRVRGFDNESCVLEGWLPPGSTLRAIADEIVKIGLAAAGSFALFLPQHQHHAPAVYAPAAFHAPLQACGIFGAGRTISLQKIAPGAAQIAEAAAAQSPHPHHLTARCPRGQIDSQKENLEALHRQFPWIPGQDSIRPTPEQIQAKHASQREIDTLYSSYLDFVLVEIFGFPSVVSPGHKLKADCSNDTLPLTVFKPNKYPYSVPQGTKHYIWWTREPMFQTPDRITGCIEAALQEIQPGHYNFVWYENPKMTIPEVYHVQVFWSRKE